MKKTDIKKVTPGINNDKAPAVEPLKILHNSTQLANIANPFQEGMNNEE